MSPQQSAAVDYCVPVSDIASRRRLRSARRGLLTVPRHRRSTAVYYVDGVVRSASHDVRNVVADYWRCLRLERSSLPDTAALSCGDIGAL